MKKLIPLIGILLSLNGIAGGFAFPNVEFEYAKCYLFNLDLEEQRHVDFRIYKEGVYAKSKLGNGILLTNEFHTKIRKAFANGIDELIMGLSKCYMPRHGIIYYDSNHQPVASLSICFECDKISVWSNKTYHFNDDYRKFNYNKAEGQMSDLHKIIKAEAIPAYTSVKDEPKYLEFILKDQTLKKQKALTLNAQEQLANFPKRIDHEMVKSWVHQSQKLKFKETIDTVKNEDGTIDISRKIDYKWNTTFHITNGQLRRANIYHPGFLLPLGVSLGMSVAEIYQKLNIETPIDGYPKELQLKGEATTIKLDFKYHTLVKVELLIK